MILLLISLEDRGKQRICFLSATADMVKRDICQPTFFEVKRFGIGWDSKKLPSLYEFLLMTNR